MEHATWKQLREFIDTLTPEELEQPASAFVEDEQYAVPLAEPFRMEKDIYVNVDDDDDSSTLEELKLAHGDEFDPANYRLATPKGKPFLYLSEDINSHLQPWAAS